MNPYESPAEVAEVAETSEQKNRTILFLFASVVILAGMVYWQRSEIKELRAENSLQRGLLIDASISNLEGASNKLESR